MGQATSATDRPPGPLSFERRDPGPKDVRVDILYCGVCHSDLHQARNEWQNTLYPCLPGHGIVGRDVTRSEVVVSRDADAMGARAGTFDVILDTVAADHDIDALLNCPKRDATPCQVGAPDRPLATRVSALIFARRNCAGSLIGGIAETQEMMDVCGPHGITADIEMIRTDEVEGAYAHMPKSDVTYRFVIDMETMPAAARGPAAVRRGWKPHRYTLMDTASCRNPGSRMPASPSFRPASGVPAPWAGARDGA